MKDGPELYIRQTAKTIKTAARVNLINLFNESICKPIKKFIKQDPYSERIKSEFHIPCNKIDFDPYTNLDNSFIRSKTVGLAYRSSTNITEDFKNFIKKHNPSKEMIHDITDIFKKNGIHLVNENKKLCALIPKKYDKIECTKMSSGKYVHFGVERFLKQVIKMKGMKPQDEFNRILYMDIAFFVVKSTSEKGLEMPQHLIILARPAGGFYNNKCKEPFVIGVYQGLFSSPNIGNEILRPFVNEMMSINKNKIIYQGMEFSAQIRAVVCDPISNSLITCTSLPNSQYGCPKCKATGVLRFNHEITSFPSTCKSTDLRIDEDFINPSQIDHHTGVPILRELNIGLISQFYIDYKSVVCMGVMKQLLELWTTKGKLDYRLNKISINLISDELKLIGENLPAEFTTKPKMLNNLNEWDAYDYRQFLLYYGPVVLQPHLPEMYYIHFLHLNLALRIMINPDEIAIKSANICRGLLRKYVQQFEEIYGEDLIDYNIHYLLHLDDITYKSFAMDSLGGFLYSKQMDVITNTINQTTNLQNLSKSIIENTKNILENSLNISSSFYPYFDKDKNLICRYALISTNPPNNYVITTEGEIIIVENIVKTIKGDVYLEGSRTTNITMYEAKPSVQKLMLVTAKENRGIYSLSRIKAKGIRIPTSYGDYVLPLLTP